MFRRKQSNAASPLTQAEAQEVARVAYELWEQRGQSHGSDQLDWYEAEKLVRERKGQKKSSPPRRNRVSVK